MNPCLNMRCCCCRSNRQLFSRLLSVLISIWCSSLARFRVCSGYAYKQGQTNEAYRVMGCHQWDMISFNSAVQICNVMWWMT